MQDTIYEVYETNADMFPKKLIHQGFHRDIAETKMVKEFTASYGTVDYMLINHYSCEPLSACWSQESLNQRGECSQ